MRRSSFQDIKNASLYEPRIEFIKRQLESLLSVVDLERDGKVVEVDGFRLKNLSDWLVTSACDPIEVFEYAASRCDGDCLFCYNRGNPPSLALGNLRRPASEEFEEMRTRVRYFPPGAGLCLFPSLGDIYEVLTHPHFMEVLRLLRQKTSKVFRITTNGMKLTPGMIADLAELKPIYLYLSLNSASLCRHRKLMKGRKPEIPINALPLLKERGIAYAVTIVPWPIDSVDEMLEDLAKTVAYADEHDPHIIEINLPGHSQYFSSIELFDLDEVWSKVVSQARKLRETVTSPIVVMPSMYEENLYENRKNLPKIMGLVKNSPAAISGLMRGDRILEINGLRISTRPQARDILSIVKESGSKEAHLLIERDNHTLPVTMNLESFSYPYSKDTDNYLGIVMMGTGFRLSYLEKLKDIVDSHRARNVLFLSSGLVKPSFQQALAESYLFSEVRIAIEVPRNNFFGGNIFMGDLLVVQDFIDCIEGHLARGETGPDLIVIPSSPFNLGGWGRDLTGRVYLDIERSVGIPVELLECKTIYD